MTSPFSNELISAYLDGELTAQEQARVEKQLRNDPELRRMCDELRALGLTLQSMPTSDPPEDLVERVLRQAERRMLLGEESNHDNTDPAAPAAPVPQVTPAAAARWNWRLVTGMVATAAAACLAAAMLFDASPLVRPENEVARRTAGDAAKGVSPAAAARADQAQPSVTASEPTDDLDSLAVDAAPAEPRVGGRLAPTAKLAGSDNETRDMSREAQSTTEWKRLERGSARNAEVTDELRDLPLDKLDSNIAGHGAAPAAASSPPQTRVPGADGLSRERSPGSVRGRAFGDDDGAGAGMGGGRGLGLRGAEGLTEFEPEDATSGSMSSSSRPEATRPQLSPQLTREVLARAAQDPASRAALAQELVQQLDANHSLLVQVSLPPDMEARFFDAADTREKNLAGEALGRAAGESLDQKRPARVRQQTTALASDDSESTRVSRSAVNVILVEGAQDDVRRSLQQLVQRADVRIRDVSLGADGQEDTARSSGLLLPQPTLPSAGDVNLEDSITAKKESPLQSDEMAEGEEIAQRLKEQSRGGPGLKADPGGGSGKANGFGGYGYGDADGQADYGSGAPRRGQQPSEGYGRAESNRGSDVAKGLDLRETGERKNATTEPARATNRDEPSPKYAAEELGSSKDVASKNELGKKMEPPSLANQAQPAGSQSGQTPAPGGQPKQTDDKARSGQEMPQQDAQASDSSSLVAGMPAQEERIVQFLFRFKTVAPAIPPAGADVQRPDKGE